MNQPTAPIGALSGIRVVDLSRVLGGPYCTMILSDHGADVIKVEPPQGDETRDWGPPFLERGDHERDASYFLGVNRNKRGIALDLSRPEGRDVLRRLLRDADVLVENFKPGSMERWGLGYEALRQDFPRLIHCRISGFGADGPLGGLPGYDAAVQAMTGLMSINGEPDRGPLRLGTPVVDLATGLYSVIAILMALQERQRSDQGQFLDMTLHDCGMALLHPQAANYFLNGKRPMPLGNPHPNISPYEKYTTARGEIFLAVGNDSQFRRLCVELNRPEIAADARFATNADRLRHRGDLFLLLQDALREHDSEALATQLLKAGVPAGAVQPIDTAMAAAHTRHRDMVVDIGPHRSLGTPIKLSRTPAGPPKEPPRFGEHNDAVLLEAGYSPEDIAALLDAGILHASRKRR